MPIQTFKKLIVLQKARQPVLEEGQHTKNFSKRKSYALTAQCRRAAILIAAKITEGYSKKGKANNPWLTNIVQWPIEERRLHLVLTGDHGYGQNLFSIALLDEISNIPESNITKILSSNS